MAAALISIIGPPAAGKTTMAHWRAEALPARPILEDYAGNPFLPGSYLGRQELALPAQLYFLFSRVSQLNREAWPEQGAAVSDYGFCQDAVYAERNLRGEDMVVYRRLAASAAAAVKQPDLLVHLDAGEQMLLERIARRGREDERAFTADFLAGMRQAYRDVAASAGCPVLPVDAGKMDLLAEDARARLLRGVREALA